MKAFAPFFAFFIASTTAAYAAPVPGGSTLDFVFSPTNFVKIDPNSTGKQTEFFWKTDLATPQDISLQLFDNTDFTKSVFDCSITASGGCGIGGITVVDLSGSIRIINNGAAFNINSLALSIQNGSGTYIYTIAGPAVPEPSTFQLLALGFAILAKFSKPKIKDIKA